MKKFAVIILLTLSFSLISTQEVEAKKYSYAHVYENGCVGIRTYHSILGGLITWVSDEIIAC